MKNVKKVRWGLLALCAALSLVFVSCKQPEDETTKTTDPTTVTDPDVKTIDDGEITVIVGETVKVKVEGKSVVDDFECEGLTITYKENGIFEITAAETMTDATVTVNFNDGTDTDDGIDVTVNVYDPYYHLTLTLDDAVKAKAATITIYAEGKEDSETTASLKQTVNATYTAGQATATAKLAKDKSNSYKYFNNIVVTVKDSEGNDIDVESTPVYFCYTDTNFTGITVSAAVASKTFTINFEGFTIAGGSVEGLRYSTVWASSPSAWAQDTTYEPVITVADDGSSATFDVEQTNEFYIDWTAVVIKDSEGSEIVISSGNTNSGAGGEWYSYSADVWSHTLTHVSGEYQSLCSAKEWSNSDEGSGDVFVQVLEASTFASLNISTLRVQITLSTGSWANASSADAWATETYANTTWSDNANAHEVVITSSDFISELKTNGLYVATSAGSAGTVTVEYIAQ